ncbi:phage Mu protein F like protein [Hephaestia caeni]|uniref:Phage Mu protein F like protein n=1 Tax=Hephaestia caeni TaxID=645617 RepID=A0A397PD15_9SPHN|nr:phage minor head protein [Hephaestia caeni]RIA44054.1 phage Mu protein F like protein [Hephaestia caeni]
MIVPEGPPSGVSGVFRKPFPEQIAFFRQKLGRLVPTERWDDITAEAHDSAFMVAGAQKADLLADLAGAVDGSIAEGKSLGAFRKEFRAIVERHGWHGWTGEDSKGGRAWRTRTIYRTNASTSYSAGRRVQLEDGDFPLWVYRHGGSVHPRHIHLHVFDGIVLPPDHPFWRKFYPPSDWGCSCYVLGARSMRAARRLGGDPDKKLPPDWDRADPKTGEPKGIGKGWGYAPGASVVSTVRALRGKLDELPPQLSIAVIQDWLGDGFARWMEDPEGSWPLVRVPEEDAALIGAKRTVADISAATVAKQHLKHPELTIAEYRSAQQVVSAATHAPIRDGDSLIYIREVLDDAAGGHVLVVKTTKTKLGLFVTSFRRLSRDEARRDRELARLLGKGDRTAT